jgi:hypothetical protein
MNKLVLYLSDYNESNFHEMGLNFKSDHASRAQPVVSPEAVSAWLT